MAKKTRESHGEHRVIKKLRQAKNISQLVRVVDGNPFIFYGHLTPRHRRVLHCYHKLPESNRDDRVVKAIIYGAVLARFGIQLPGIQPKRQVCLTGEQFDTKIGQAIVDSHRQRFQRARRLRR